MFFPHGGHLSIGGVFWNHDNRYVMYFFMLQLCVLSWMYVPCGRPSSSWDDMLVAFYYILSFQLIKAFVFESSKWITCIWIHYKCLPTLPNTVHSHHVTLHLNIMSCWCVLSTLLLCRSGMLVLDLMFAISILLCGSVFTFMFPWRGNQFNGFQHYFIVLIC